MTANSTRVYGPNSISSEHRTYEILDYTRGAGGPQGLVSNHLKSGGNEEDGGNLLKRISDVRFSLSDQIMKSSH